ncbi:MAG: hypothetical protein Q4A75_08200, partial [Peptostreptococcaceae bacterium]|nr:hypothetical protein [Peptostreptococcaceae bacterium]
MRKKLLVMMLTVCMVIGMMPMSGMAQEAPESRKMVIEIKEGSDTIAEKIASMGEINPKIYEIDFEIQKDYTLTEADTLALSHTHKNFTVIVRAHTLTMEKVDPTDDGLREVAVEVYPGARIIYAGEEIIGSEQA